MSLALAMVIGFGPGHWLRLKPSASTQVIGFGSSHRLRLKSLTWAQATNLCCTLDGIQAAHILRAPIFYPAGPASRWPLKSRRMSHVRSEWFSLGFKPFNISGNADDCGAAGRTLRRQRAGRVRCGAGSDRGSRSGRHPRPAPLGGGILGSSGHHQQRGFGESGRLRHVQSDPLGGAVLSRQRQSLARSCGSAAPHQPAGAGPGPHAGADEQQAPAPRIGHPVDIQWGLQRRPGARHFRHSRHRHPAHGSAARRGGGPVRLRRHRRGAELRPEGRGRRRHHRGKVRRLYRKFRRGHDLHRRQRRAAAGRQRFRELQLRVRRVRAHRPQRAARGTPPR